MEGSFVHIIRERCTNGDQRTSSFLMYIILWYYHIDRTRTLQTVPFLSERWYRTRRLGRRQRCIKNRHDHCRFKLLIHNLWLAHYQHSFDTGPIKLLSSNLCAQSSKLECSAGLGPIPWTHTRIVLVPFWRGPPSWSGSSESVTASWTMDPMHGFNIHCVS